MRYAMTLAAIALTACVTPKVTEQPTGQTVNYRQFRTVSYNIHDLPSTQYGADHAHGKRTIEFASALLGERLKAMGYTVVPENSELSIDVAVKAAHPGSAATRFLIGFGAGRAMFLYDATFSDANGTRLGAFEGGRSHTGMEWNESFAGRDRIQTIAAAEAVDQIEEFIANGGRFPSKEEKTR